MADLLVLTLYFTPTVASALRRGSDDGAAGEVAAVLRDEGLALQPLHPEGLDPSLDRTFSVQVPADKAEALRQRLSSLEGVDGAYFKPSDEAP